MKGVATLQQHGYLLLMYNNGFLHHVCTATPQYFRRHITNSPNRHLQMTNTTVEYWWIHWISGPWENSVAPSWMGMFVIPKYSSLKVKLALHICQLPVAKKSNKRTKQTVHSVFYWQYSLKDLFNNSSANSWLILRLTVEGKLNHNANMTLGTKLTETSTNQKMENREYKRCSAPSQLS